MTIIEQKPLFTQLPVGQDVIFTVSNDTIVANQIKVKFIAEVHISSSNPPNLSTTTDLVGTFKTTPNGAGVGIFDLRAIVENYVSADNLASTENSGTTTYKGIDSTTKPFALHLVDKYSRNTNSVRWLAIQFKTQYVDTNGDTQIVQAVNSENYLLFNGYLKYTDVLQMGSGATQDDFGLNISKYNLSSQTDSFLTNAPTTQYANLNDYGTLAILIESLINVSYIKFTYNDSSGSQIGTENLDFTYANGALNSTVNNNTTTKLIYFGCFGGNLQNYSSTFQALVTAGTINGGSIDVQAFDVSNNRVSQRYTININCPDLRNFESIRLCWLNQWGAWDYYTFTKKSTRNISTQGTTYHQLEGTWNDSKYRLDSFRGGKKTFRVNTTERISMNTDFVSEDDNIMFEELINSPEVYLLKEFEDTTETFSALNQYVVPVRLTTSSFTRKTIANDKLIQYTFEIEKSKTFRTQTI